MGKPKSRGNKQGSVYYRANRKTWVAQITIGWKPPTKEDGHLIPIKKTFGGFKSKKEAKAALDKLLHGEIVLNTNVSLNDVFEEWYKAYESRVAPKTMKGYRQAFAYFADVQYRKINTITAAELQSCLDKCPKGKRTHQLMKVVAGLIWNYALDTDKVSKNIAKNLYIGKHTSKIREPLSAEEICLIKDSIGSCGDKIHR